MNVGDVVYDNDRPAMTGLVRELFPDGTVKVWWHQGHFHGTVPQDSLTVKWDRTGWMK